MIEGQEFKFFLSSGPRTEILRFVFTHTDEDGALCGHFVGMPDQQIRVIMPYPVFDSAKELIEYYEKILEEYANRERQAKGD